MKYKNRLLEDKLKKLGEYFPVVVLTGARQVGKTTLLKHLDMAKSIYTFDPLVDIGGARGDPDLFLSNVEIPAIFDEIQFAPQLLSAIKRKVDVTKDPGQYWLTGSQQWGVLKNVAESLAGRAAIVSLLPMSLGERFGSPSQWVANFLENPDVFLANKHVCVEHASASTTKLLWQGGYPGLLEISDDLLADAFASYLHTYVERDLRLIGDVSDWQEFTRFVQLLANLTAQEINYSQLGREIGINPQTAKQWLRLLMATYQWIEIPPFSGNTIKRISGKSKGYFIDTGFACYLMHINSQESLLGHPRLGALFETFVVLDICKQLAIFSGKPELHHWRAHSGAEVDLIIEINNRYFPIEIKYKSHPTKSDTSGIEAFRSHYPHLPIGPGLVIAPVESIFPLTHDCFVVPFDLA